jgi:hypothetical protein
LADGVANAPTNASRELFALPWSWQESAFAVAIHANPKNASQTKRHAGLFPDAPRVLQRPCRVGCDGGCSWVAKLDCETGQEFAGW